MDVLRVIEPGLFTTVQDMGRYGFRLHGISEGGAFDKLSFIYANLCVGNEPYLPAFEITLQGPRLEVLNDTILSITGANLQARVNNKVIPLYTPIEVRKGDILSFGKRKWGCRAYLAIQGGVSCDRVFESYSTDTRIGYGGLKLVQRGHVIKQLQDSKIKRLSERKINYYNKDFLFNNTTDICEVEVIEGPDFEFFCEENYKSFYTGIYEVTSYLDRVGIRLKGPSIKRSGKEMLSRPVSCGNIQITPDGYPIILGVESQTVGGYPRIACVISADLGKIAQLFTGDKIRFKKTTAQSALNKLKLLYSSILTML